MSFLALQVIFGRGKQVTGTAVLALSLQWWWRSRMPGQFSGAPVSVLLLLCHRAQTKLLNIMWPRSGLSCKVWLTPVALSSSLALGAKRASLRLNGCHIYVCQRLGIMNRSYPVDEHGWVLLWANPELDLTRLGSQMLPAHGGPSWLLTFDRRRAALDLCTSGLGIPAAYIYYAHPSWQDRRAVKRPIMPCGALENLGDCACWITT